MKYLSYSIVFIFMFIPGVVLAQADQPSDASTDTPDAGDVLIFSREERLPGQLGYPSQGPVHTGQEITAGRIATTENSLSLACKEIKFKSLIDILIWLKCIAVSVLIPLIFAAAFVVFLWGVLKFMYSADKPKRDEAKKLVWWGLIGLFVMVSVWGILEIARVTLGIDPLAVPTLETTYLDVNKASR